MSSELACVACMVDPQTTSMVVPMAQATLIAVPFFFRSRIADAIRRAASATSIPSCRPRPRKAAILPPMTERTDLSLQERYAPEGHCFGCGPANTRGPPNQEFPVRHGRG